MEDFMNNNVFFETNLINDHYEEILDIIGKKFKSSKDIHRNRDKILSLLKETFIGIDAKKLSNGFNLIKEEYKVNNKNVLSKDSIEEINTSINNFLQIILEQNDFKDYGYSLLICFYFYITE